MTALEGASPDSQPKEGISKLSTNLKVSVVIPTLNEEENLYYVLPRIPTWVHEVVLVDGHSTDGTIETAQRLYPGLRVIQQSGRGKGDALRCAYQAVTGDIVVVLDADGSTDPAEIPRFVQPLLNGADIAKGSRFLKGGGSLDLSSFRRVGNWALVVLVRILFGADYTDLCYGYNAYWADILPRLDSSVDGFEIETKINIQIWCESYRIVEVPSFESKRIYGNSHLQTIPDGWRVLKTILRDALTFHLENFKRKPAHVAHAERIRGDMLLQRVPVERID